METMCKWVIIYFIKNSFILPYLQYCRPILYLHNSSFYIFIREINNFPDHSVSTVNTAGDLQMRDYGKMNRKCMACRANRYKL